MESSTKRDRTVIVFLFAVAIVMVLIGSPSGGSNLDSMRRWRWWLSRRSGERCSLSWALGLGVGAVTDGAKLASEVASNTGYVITDTVAGLQKSQVEAAKAHAAAIKADSTIRVLDAREQQRYAQAAVRSFAEAQRAGQLAAGDWDRALTDDDGQGAQSQSGAVYYD